MAGNWATLKRLCRQTVHNVMAVDALYSDSTLDAPVGITARFHTKLTLMGDLDQQGYASMIEGIKSIIFNQPELTSKALTLRRNGKVEFPDYGFSMYLDSMNEPDDLVEVSWIVTKDLS